MSCCRDEGIEERLDYLEKVCSFLLVGREVESRRWDGKRGFVSEEGRVMLPNEDGVVRLMREDGSVAEVPFGSLQV